jgi:hypothetical protein
VSHDILMFNLCAPSYTPIIIEIGIPRDLRKILSLSNSVHSLDLFLVQFRTE